MKLNDLKTKRGTWIFLVPINNLKLTEAVNKEFRINKVTFISASKLPYKRIKLGFPERISELREKMIYEESFFEEVETFATFRLTGQPKELKKEFIKQTKDELAILSLSQLGYSKRRINSFPAISEEAPIRKRDYLVIDSKTGEGISFGEVVGKHSILCLNQNWKEFSDNCFYTDLLKILTNQIKVTKSWKKDLYNAAILVGQSQHSTNIPQAFLWNMIALELLLTRQGDKYSDMLPKRIEAFLGWMGYWERAGYEDRIKQIYSKRCRFVHQGDRECIRLDDLFFTDDLLLNLFTNIVGHINLFKSKKDIIDFSSKIEAEHTLGIKSKIRPKTLRFLSRKYNEKDYEKYKY